MIIQNRAQSSITIAILEYLIDIENGWIYIFHTAVSWGRNIHVSCYSNLKVLGKSVGLCKTTKRKDQLYISLLVSVWRIICENFNPNGLMLAEI